MVLLSACAPASFSCILSEDLQVLRSFPIPFPEVSDSLHTLRAVLPPAPKSVFFAAECSQPRACPRESRRALAQTGCKHSLLGLHSLATRIETGGAEMVDCVLAAVYKFQPLPAQIPLLPSTSTSTTRSSANATALFASRQHTLIQTTMMRTGSEES
jgi:hypothetical protein